MAIVTVLVVQTAREVVPVVVMIHVQGTALDAVTVVVINCLGG